NVLLRRRRNSEDVGRTSVSSGTIVLFSAATIVGGPVCCWASPQIYQSNISLLAQLSYVGLVQLAHFLSRPPSLMIEVLTSKSSDVLVRRIGETVGGTYGRRTCSWCLTSPRQRQPHSRCETRHCGKQRQRRCREINRRGQPRLCVGVDRCESRTA